MSIPKGTLGTRMDEIVISGHLIPNVSLGMRTLKLRFKCNSYRSILHHASLPYALDNLNRNVRLGLKE